MEWLEFRGCKILDIFHLNCGESFAALIRTDVQLGGAPGVMAPG